MTAYKGLSSVKFIILWTLMLSLLTFGYFFAKPYFNSSTTLESPIIEKSDLTADINDTEYDGIKEAGAPIQNEYVALKSSKEPSNPDDTSKPFNILIVGIDRRSGDQTSFRTDVIQLITISADRKNAVVTHIPRDVWAGAYKINSIYNLKGPEALKDNIERITGQRPDRIIRVDFDAFVYAIDAIGGIDINVPVGFTDDWYPNDRNGNEDIISIKFESGQQVMNGETALMYARSRKGTNGEGSDYARGTRQQLVMAAVVKDFFKPKNLFNPKTAEVLYQIAMKKVYTDITLSDTKILFELLLNYKNININYLSLDTSNLLVNPTDRTPYNGAWTLIAKDNDYSPIHNEISSYIN